MARTRTDPNCSQQNDMDGADKKQCFVLEKICKIREMLPKVIKEFTSYNVDNFSSFKNFVEWMHHPTDAAALGIARMLFGIVMLIDIPDERGGGILDLRFGDSKDCHFPLFDFIHPLIFPKMAVVYFIMWLGALGIALGYKYKMSTLMFICPYWYIFLLNKAAWNNHSYLYGLCGTLLFFTSANKFCSLDYRNSKREDAVVPYWNYFIIKFQFFTLYFLAGVKKMSTEWLSGYAMTNLGYHWVFTPFRYILGVEMTELLIIHWFGAIFDLTIAFFLIWEKTRVPATPFAIMFHLMNSRLFSIGMFPWLCLAELPLFYNASWPRNICKMLTTNKQQQDDLKKHESESYHTEPIESTGKCKQIGYNNQELRLRKPTSQKIEHPKVMLEKENSSNSKISAQSVFNVIIILIYCGVQFFLPFSHFITKGYNNWTNGLYGYSWDMMVHSYDTILTSIKVIDNDSGQEHYLEPYAFTDFDRWTKHADMAIQYAKCIQRNLEQDVRNNPNTVLTSTNLSIYFDIWCSMNGRFQQRVFDPRVDLLKAEWSPFEKTKWVLPLLNELTEMRPRLDKITQDVLSWGNYTDVLFIADFPGLEMENFISPDLGNVSLTVLQGAIRMRIEGHNETHEEAIGAGQSVPVTAGIIHKINTISEIPSCYMYTYVNNTMVALKIEVGRPDSNEPILPLWEEFTERAMNYGFFIAHILNSLQFLLVDHPLPRRVRDRS